MNRYPSYKPSGAVWLHEIPSGWTMSKVGSHFKQRNEKVAEFFALSVSKAGVVPQLENVALSNAEGESRKLVKKGDFVVNSRSDRKGSCGVSDSDGTVSLINIVLEPHDVNGKYIHYLFRSNAWVEEFYRNGHGIVADLWTTNYQTMKGMMLPIPTPDEQERIVSFLDSKLTDIDSFIAAKQRQVELLEEYKQAIIAQAVTRGLNPDVKMKPTGYFWLPEIPENWKIKRMKYLFTERSEKNHPDEQMLSATQTYGVIPQSQYGNRVVVVNTGFEGLKLVKVGDFVIHLRSFQGGIEISHAQGIISSAYTILRPIISDDGDYSPYFRFLFKSQNFIDLLKICVTGIREGQNINYAKLKQYFLPIPPIEEQKRIVKYIDTKTSEIDTLLSSIAKEISLLQEYKQRLISDVVTGQINVQNEIV